MTQPFTYFRPASRTEAVNLLAREDINCLPLIIHPKPANPRSVGADAFVDLSLLGMNELQMDPDGTLHLGSLLTIQHLIDESAQLTGSFTLLSQAAALVATPGIRNLSTIWGSAVASDGSPEIILVLLALDAKVVIHKADNSLQTLPFSRFLETLPVSLAKADLITEFILPPVRASVCSLQRISRTPRDEAIVAVAAVMHAENGSPAQIKLAMAGAHSRPQCLPDVEKKLAGQSLTPELLEEICKITMVSTNPVPDFRGGVVYRRCMAGVIVRRVITRIWEQAVAAGLVSERSDQ